METGSGEAKHLWWVRRDLSGTSPAACAAAGSRMAALLVLDPAFSTTTARHAWYLSSAAALHHELQGHLDIRSGMPEEILSAYIHEHSITDVYVTGEFTPYGTSRDARIEKLLTVKGVGFHRSGSPYLVPPGTLLTREGHPFSRFTPFFQAWLSRLQRDAPSIPSFSWITEPSALPFDIPSLPYLPEAGHTAAVQRLNDFIENGLAPYDEARDRPDLDGTSRLSPYLKVGSLHPQEILTAISRYPSHVPFLRQLAWREFFADLLHHDPESASRDWSPAFSAFPWADPETCETEIAAWKEGRTGYPLVDAGMRELLTTGTMHNRVRMAAASFLVKDLNVHWTIGARHFMDHLIDGDVASNTHNWQWVAGTGADAAPYFRIFNPTRQAERFDPEGTYIRRFLPELSSLPIPDLFTPWNSVLRPRDYPLPIIDHDEAQRAAKPRYSTFRSSSRTDRDS